MLASTYLTERFVLSARSIIHLLPEKTRKTYKNLVEWGRISIFALKYKINMNKRYKDIQNESSMLNEALANGYREQAISNDYVVADSPWDSPDSPCNYSMDELQSVLLDSINDCNTGKLHSYEDVMQLISCKIQEWK